MLVQASAPPLAQASAPPLAQALAPPLAQASAPLLAQVSVWASGRELVLASAMPSEMLSFARNVGAALPVPPALDPSSQ